MSADLLLLALQRDLLGNILEYSADAGRCAESITSQVREMIGTRIVALFERNLVGEFSLLAACPRRKEEILKGEAIRKLVAGAGDFREATLVEPGNGEVGEILTKLGMNASFFVPLRVGEESFGLLLLLDLMDSQGIAQILEGLQDISGLLSLVLKNAYLYRNMEQLAEERTRALLESERRSRIILQTAMDGFWCVDSTGQLLDVNDAYCRMSGYSREELLTMSISQLEVNESKEMVAAHLGKVLAEGFDSFESVHRRKDGTLLKLDLRVQLRFGSDGREIVVFLRDITERKRLEEERQHLQIQLQQAQKMEAIGTLAGGIAHDFNNILGAILGYAEMAQDDCPTDSQVRYDLDQVVKAGVRARDLVKQILAFSRLADTEPVPMRPAVIIKESIKLLRSTLPSSIIITHHVDAEAGTILADPTQIHQIMMNLCTNAFHAMEMSGGTLTITLQEKTLLPGNLIKEPAVQAGDYVELLVADTGTGMDPEIRDRIFEPYFTTKEVGKGTGMGLSIVHGIVKSCGGFITCLSQRGQGTTFQVLLPRLAGAEQLETSPADIIYPGNEHILFIDDEELLVDMGKALLERIGYRVTTRTNSIDALNTFQNDPDAFDLVITDQTMPTMAGDDLARRILQIRPDMPIILCTGYSNSISEAKAMALGIKGFAMKPLAKKEITAIIRRVLDGQNRTI